MGTRNGEEQWSLTMGFDTGAHILLSQVGFSEVISEPRGKSPSTRLPEKSGFQ
jgi:hypothetical protein